MRNPDAAQSELLLRTLPSINVDKVIAAVQQLNLGTTLVFCSCDGSVEFRSRVTLDPLPRDDTPARASSIAQVGLGFPEGNLCKSHSPLKAG